MSIAGNLNTMPLAELLQWLSQSTKSGTLIIKNGEVEKRIFFRDGRIFSSASTDPKEHLGHFLVSYGFITEQELTKAIEMQESNKMLLGKILVTIGAVQEPDVQRLLRLKAEESIYDLFGWREADFRFLEGGLPDSHLIPIDLDATAIILEGARRVDEWRRIREVIPSTQCIPVAVEQLTDPGIDQGAFQILTMVNDDRTVEEICLRSHSTEYRVCKLLFDQVRRGRVKVVRPRAPARVDAKPATPAFKADAISPDTLIALAEKHIARGDFQAGVRHLRAARSLEPDHREVQRKVEQVEARIREAIEKAGVHLEAVPQLNIDFERLTNLDISPQEGFILSRIDGQYDLKSILKISPMQQLDGLIVFWRLLREGHIRLEAR
ncbi:MAG TPA: DUF4388 domain-containing protein [Thermoanaerobaculia bacterium]|nr:DUF4388 domain-containing protein [Thermoanaerobaculia bacterium]